MISDDTIRLQVYIGGGLVSVVMLKILDVLVKKARKQIEEDALIQIQSKGEYAPKKTDKIIECATMIGYLSPLLCIATWISEIENSQVFKWGIIVLVHILGVIMPIVLKKKN